MNLEEVAMVMNEYGSAVRGDWGSLDGRVVRSDMETMADAVLVPANYDFLLLRDSLGLCDTGMGHWTDYCDGGCADGE